MKNSPLANVTSKMLQRGVAAVEFALVAIPFLLLLLGAMEFGRLLYLWNTAQEMTRNAARQAVVTDFNDSTAIAAIKRSAAFAETDGGFMPGSSEISTANVVIQYLYVKTNGDVAPVKKMPVSPADNIAACLDATRLDECIRFVEVCLSTGTTCDDKSKSIPFKPMIGLFSSSGTNSTDLTGLRIPLSTVRMPAESLGFDPTLPE
ncbi:MAG: TadE/TadG family type IV pilus assembly protein [Rhodoferax sp.]|nr:TadE/TadG family type IV pilus assembly protein [Rhodoferax sp.]MDD2918558.1 TadE/TadG family type IV pilus assembly protein [Rhodoferax sp.]